MSSTHAALLDSMHRRLLLLEGRASFGIGAKWDEPPHVWERDQDFNDFHDPVSDDYYPPPKVYPRFRTGDTKRNTELLKRFILTLKDAEDTDLETDIAKLLGANRRYVDYHALCNSFRSSFAPRGRGFNDRVLEILEGLLAHDGRLFLPTPHDPSGRWSYT